MFLAHNLLFSLSLYFDNCTLWTFPSLACTVLRFIDRGAREGSWSRELGRKAGVGVAVGRWRGN